MPSESQERIFLFGDSLDLGLSYLSVSDTLPLQVRTNVQNPKDQEPFQLLWSICKKNHLRRDFPCPCPHYEIHEHKWSEFGDAHDTGHTGNLSPRMDAGLMFLQEI